MDWNGGACIFVRCSALLAHKRGGEVARYIFPCWFCSCLTLLLASPSMPNEKPTLGLYESEAEFDFSARFPMSAASFRV